MRTGEAASRQSDIADLVQCAIAAITHHRIGALCSFGNGGPRSRDDT
jgi:hypothetical protein